MHLSAVIAAAALTWRERALPLLPYARPTTSGIQMALTRLYLSITWQQQQQQQAEQG
jgi:hypothetical protein